MLAENRCDSWPGDGDRTPDVRLAVVAQVAAGERDPPALGVAEAEQELDDRGLAGAARSDERHAGAGRQAEVDAVQRGLLAVRVAGTDALEREGERRPRRRRCDAGVGDAHRAGGEVEDPAPGAERGGELARGRRQRLDRLERGEREQSEHGDEHRVEAPRRR